MIKGLEVLERIGKCYVNSESKDLMFTDDYGDDYDIIERELKALEIIKNKGIDYHSISAIKQSKDYEDYLDLVENLITVVFKFTKEEFDLLKEVFCNEKQRLYKRYTNVYKRGL